MTKPVRLILVSCVGCGRLHTPEHALALNPRCESCRAAESSAPRAGR